MARYSKVETNIAPAANCKKSGYDYRGHTNTFDVNDLAWFLVSSHRKLGSKWQGDWKENALKSMVITEISNEKSQQLNARNQGMITGIVLMLMILFGYLFAPKGN